MNKSTAPAKGESSPNKIDLENIKYDPNAMPIWELAARLAAKVPDEEWAKIPTDLARNFDFYQSQRDDARDLRL
jgi:type I restriction enzyme, S subunit